MKNVKKNYFLAALVFSTTLLLGAESQLFECPPININTGVQDPYAELRHFLYKMKSDLTLVRNIQENRKFYETIIEIHMMSLYDQRAKIIALCTGLAIPFVAAPVAFSSFCSVVLIHEWLDNNMNGIETIRNCTIAMGSCAIMTGYCLYHIQKLHNQGVQSELDRDKQVLEALRKL